MVGLRACPCCDKIKVRTTASPGTPCKSCSKKQSMFCTHVAVVVGFVAILYAESAGYSTVQCINKVVECVFRAYMLIMDSLIGFDQAVSPFHPHNASCYTHVIVVYGSDKKVVLDRCYCMAARAESVLADLQIRYFPALGVPYAWLEVEDDDIIFRLNKNVMISKIANAAGQLRLVLGVQRGWAHFFHQKIKHL